MRALHTAGRFTVGPRGLPLTLRMEHTDWSGRGLCRLTLSSALPGGFEVADGAALARLGLGEGAEVLASLDSVAHCIILGAGASQQAADTLQSDNVPHSTNAYRPRPTFPLDPCHLSS